MELEDGAKLGSIIPDLPHLHSVAIIKPSKTKEQKTQNIKLTTSAGEVIIELTKEGQEIISEDFLKKSPIKTI